jgi:branched-chain amino acid aminotransferase
MTVTTVESNELEKEYEYIGKIKVEHIAKDELKSKYESEENLGFGQIFTDRMFYMEYHNGTWEEPIIKKFGPLILHPAAKALHYSQEIFEGMKAYRTANGHINLFRPDMNIKRFNNSAYRLMMPKIDPEMFLESLTTLIKLEKDWAPVSPGSSLYVRPTYIGVTGTLGVQPASDYIYYVILSPSGAYFPEGFNPIKICVSEKYLRAAKGGTGFAKTGGNYAGTLLAGQEAAQHGCSQVLWLSPERTVEEVGAMNIFFVKDGIIYTAPLTTGTILPGVTRDSVIQLAKDMGYTVKEESLHIDDVINGIHDGSLTEIFGSGTAASIAPVGSLFYKDKFHEVNNFETGEISKKLYKELTDIQWSRKPDPYGWVYRVC